jgi:hypothetical protein
MNRNLVSFKKINGIQFEIYKTELGSTEGYKVVIPEWRESKYGFECYADAVEWCFYYAGMNFGNC